MVEVEPRNPLKQEIFGERITKWKKKAAFYCQNLDFSSPKEVEGPRNSRRFVQHTDTNS